MHCHLNTVNTSHKALYQKIQSFALDLPKAKLCFSQRLARENGWSLQYTYQVIEEYKKFAFLAVAAGHPVTPSDQVDQVWHLHLSYTRSYWEDFCPNILQTPLHHQPTNGGTSEQLKFDDWYAKTLESYTHFFEQAPPTSVWPAPKDRFGRDLNFLRVNVQQNWVVSKPSLRKLKEKLNRQTAVLIPLFGLTFGLTGCQSITSLLDLKGSEFLTFYVSLLGVTAFLAFCLRNLLRLPSGDPRQGSRNLEIYDKAYLAHGEKRAVETAIATLRQKYYVDVQPAERRLMLTKKSRTQAFDPMEQAVIDAIELDGNIDKVHQEVIQATHVIRDRLRQRNLLLSPRRAFNAKFYPVLMMVSCLGLGLAKIWVGILRDKPVGFLGMLCILTAVIALWFWVTPVERSLYGDRVFQKLRADVKPSLAQNLTEAEIPLGFALFGLTVLPRDMSSSFSTVFTPVNQYGGGWSDGGGGWDSGGGWSDGGGDGGGGGGGCGGGGCGGCGGG